MDNKKTICYLALPPWFLLAFIGFSLPVPAAVLPAENYLVFFSDQKFAEIPYAASLDLTGGAFTVSAWIKPASWGQGDQGRIVDHGGGSSGSSGWSLQLENKPGLGSPEALRFRINNASSYDSKSNTHVITLHQWQHVAVTFDNGTLTFFVDGIESGVRTGVPAPTARVAPLRIGMRADDLARGFIGSIDEVRIWNRALSQQEIQAGMSQELSGSETGLLAYYRFNEGSGQQGFDGSGNGHDAALGSTPGADDNDPVWATPTEWPTFGWNTATPEEMSMDSILLEEARDYSFKTGSAGYITRRGKLVMSWGDPARLFDLKSTSKSIGVTVLGMAIGDGLVDLNAPAQQYLPEIGTPPDTNTDTGWLDDITLLHLATHTAGFAKPGGYIDLLFEPGTTWSYSDGGANWLADVLTAVYGQDLSTLMSEEVFTPLGIFPGELTWRSNSYRPEPLNGITRREFGSGISANVDAMARIGYLYLRNGMWDGRQILPPGFVAEASTAVTDVTGLPVNNSGDFFNASDHYGYLWWNNADGTLPDVPTDAFWSWGLHDSLIVVIPSLDIVATRAGGGGWRSGWNADYTVLDPFITPIALSVINQVPVAVTDAFTVTAGSLLSGDVTLDNGNGTDSLGDPPSVISPGTVTVANGNLVLHADGAFEYTPNPGYAGDDSFSYYITDYDSETSGEATVSISVLPDNQAPLAADDDFTVNQDTAANPLDILSNDSDPDLPDDTLTVTAVTATSAGGTVTNQGAYLEYTPLSGFTGVDTFTYTIEDNKTENSTALVSVTVIATGGGNNPPLAVNDDYQVDQDSSANPLDVLMNDGDPDLPEETLAITAVGVASAGGAVTNLGTSLLYTPVVGYSGIERFVYTIQDGGGSVSTALVTMTVVSPGGVNNPPQAMADQFTVDQGANPNFLDVLANDSDPDLPTDSVSIVAVGATSAGATVTNQGSALQYTPVAGFAGTETFTYTILDTAGATSRTVVTVSVTNGDATGDLTGDGLVDVRDVLRGYRILANAVVPDGNEVLRGDVAPLYNGVPLPDGFFNLGDQLLIINKVMGRIDF